MALSHSPRSDCVEEQITQIRLVTQDLEVSVFSREQLGVLRGCTQAATQGCLGC